MPESKSCPANWTQSADSPQSTPVHAPRSKKPRLDKRVQSGYSRSEELIFVPQSDRRESLEMQKIAIVILAIILFSGCRKDNRQAMEDELDALFSSEDDYKQMVSHARNEIPLNFTVRQTPPEVYCKDLIDVAAEIRPYHDFLAEPPFSFCIFQRDHFKIAVLQHGDDMDFFIQYEGEEWEWRGSNSNGWISCDPCFSSGAAAHDPLN